MKLHTLKPAAGSVHTGRRLGRGAGSGLGGTSTRGHKGAKQRSGFRNKIGFEGGQMPLQRRLPKFGFKNINRVEYQAVNIGSIQKLAEQGGLEKIGVTDIVNAGLASKNDRIKILGKGELTAKVEVEAHAFSKSAETAITAAGGKATKV